MNDSEPERAFTRTEWDSLLQKWSSGFPRLRARVAEWRRPVQRKLATNGNKDTWDPRTPGGGEASATTGSVTALREAGSHEDRGGAGEFILTKRWRESSEKQFEWMKHRCRRTRNSKRYSGRASGMGEGGGLGFRKGCLEPRGEKGWEGWPGFPCETRPARMRGRQECPLLTQGSKDHTSSGGGTAARTQILGNPLNFHQERLGLGEAGPHSSLARQLGHWYSFLQGYWFNFSLSH